MDKDFHIMKIIIITILSLLLFFYLAGPAYSENKTTNSEQKIELTTPLKDKSNPFKLNIDHKSIFASSSLSGEGAKNATSYDMSIYESSLYRSFGLLDKSIYFTNPNFPVVDGSAFTSETFFNLTYKASDKITAGLSAQLYSNADSDYPDGKGVQSQRISRVFGVSQPLGHWTGRTNNSNGISSVKIPNLYFGFWNMFLQGKTENSNWKLELGSINLNMSKGINKYLDSDLFLFRTPINQMSIFGHFSRQGKYFSEIEAQQRMPGYGARFMGNTNDVYYELFSLKNDESPVSIGQRYSYYGARVGIAKDEYRLFLDAIHSTQNLFSTAASDGIYKKSEDLLAIEYEHDFTKKFAAYGSAVISKYSEYGVSNRNFDDNAFVGGIAYKPNEKFTVGIKYQHLGPNYEPIGHHKNSVYIYNYKGFKTDLKYTWGTELEKQNKRNFVTLSYSNFFQIDPNINKKDFSKSDYIFPDLTPDITAGAGRVQILSPEFNIRFRNYGIDLGGYYEKLNMSKDLMGHKPFNRQTDNYSIWANIDISKQLELILGYREVNFSGEWMNKSESYSSYQKCFIPKIGVAYERDEDFEISAQFNFYNFKDFSSNELGVNNDWENTLFLLETKLHF